MDATEGGWLRSAPIAHRGLHDSVIPENSMPAFEAAVQAGYGIELDVHVTADGRLVVMHDDDIARMTGSTGFVVEMRCSELTTLGLLDTEFTVPTLDDVLRMVAGRVPVLIEVKTGSPMTRLGPAMAAVLRGYAGPVAVQSFDPRVLLWLRRNLPRVSRGQLSGSFTGIALTGIQKLLLRSMCLNIVTAPNFLAFEVEAMPSLFASAWRRILGVPLLLWTVRTAEQLERAAHYRANVIFESVQPPSGMQ